MSASDSVTPGVYADALVTSYRGARGAHKHSFRQVLVAVEMVADFVTCASGVWAACLLDVSLHGGPIHYPGREVATLSIMAGLFAVLGLKKDGAYAGGGSLLQIRETERALRISVQLVLLLLPLSLLPSAAVSGTAVLIAPVTVAIALMLQKQAFLSIIRLLHQEEYRCSTRCALRCGQHGPANCLRTSPFASSRTSPRRGGRRSARTAWQFRV